jgi:uncharacterized protein (TIGR02996 family)
VACWPGVGESRNPALEAAIVADPDDAAGYAVYGDWLAERGDPRGELIATQLAAETRPSLRGAARAVFARHRAYFLGPLGEALAAEALDWRFGFIHRARLTRDDLLFVDGARVSSSLAKAAEHLLAHPSARFLAELVVVDDVAEIVDRLAAAVPPTLRALRLGGPTGRETVRNLVGLWPRIAGVRRLEIRGLLGLGEVELPAVTDVELHSLEVTRRVAAQLASARWPRIERLRLHCTGVFAPAHGELAALARRTDMPALTRLGVITDSAPYDLLDALVRGPVLPRLTELEVMLDEFAIRRLEREAGAFRHLALTVTDGRGLGDDALARLRRVCHSVAWSAGAQFPSVR